MKNLLKFFHYFLIIAVLFSSCVDLDQNTTDTLCTTDPSTTVAENVVGTWNVFDEYYDTVTFKSDGTGFASTGGWFTVTDGHGNEYSSFTWTVESNGNFNIAWNFGGPAPINTATSVSHNITNNECDKVTFLDAYGTVIDLTR